MASKPFPYDVLFRGGVFPNSSARSAQDNFNPAAGLDRTSSAVWRAMRSLEYRLETDFFLYQIRNPSGLRSLFVEILNSEGPIVDSDFQAALGVDAAVALILLGRREEGKRALDLAQRETFDRKATHHLALACYAEAQELHTKPGSDPGFKLTAALWRRTIAAWTGVLSDENYWNDWCSRRQSIYGSRQADSLSAQQREEVRSRLRGRLSAELAFRSRAAGVAVRAEAYLELGLVYEVEWRAAQLLKLVGGLELESGAAWVGGPLLVEELGLQNKLGKLVAKLQKEMDEYLAVEPISRLGRSDPAVSRETLDPLRHYFSELAMPALLIALRRPQDGISRLRSLNLSAEGFGLRNPAYSEMEGGENRFRIDLVRLEIQSHLAVAEMIITSSSIDVASTCDAWKQAMQQAEKIESLPEVAELIGQQAIGRVQSMDGEPGDRREILTLAIELLQAAAGLAGLTEDVGARITLCLAEQLKSRAVRLSKAKQFEAALTDLKAALRMYPDDLQIVDEFCSCLIWWASELEEHDSKRALKMLDRAQKMAQSHLDRAENESLRDTLRWATDRIAILKGGSPDPRAWHELETMLGEFHPAADPNQQQVQKHWFAADEKRIAGDYTGACGEIRQALDLVPGHAASKELLGLIYEDWAAADVRAGAFQGALTTARAAVDQGCDPELLERVRRAIDETVRRTNRLARGS